MYTIKILNETQEEVSSTSMKSIPNFHNLTPGTKERITIISKRLIDTPYSRLNKKGIYKLLNIQKHLSFEGDSRAFKNVIYDIDLG